jgi:hypothetical protein
MSFFKKIFGGDEIKAAIGTLDEAKISLNNPAYSIVRAEIDKVLNRHASELKNIIANGTPPRQWAYSAIANVAGDLLESGQFHLYRGVLNPVGHGQDLLKLYDTALDELVKMGAMSSSSTDTEKKALRNNLKSIG